MATWCDIDNIRISEPTLPMADIARRLGVNSGWVRATFKRKKWTKAPRGFRGRRLADEVVAAVVADYTAGMPYRDIGSRNGISKGYVPTLVKRCAPDLFRTRPRGPNKRRMCDADLYGAV